MRQRTTGAVPSRIAFAARPVVSGVSEGAISGSMYAAEENVLHLGLSRRDAERELDVHAIRVEKLEEDALHIARIRRADARDVDQRELRRRRRLIDACRLEARLVPRPAV